MVRPENQYHHIIKELYPSLYVLIGLIYVMDLPHRKVLLKAVRIQGPFSRSSRFYLRYTTELRDIKYTPHIMSRNAPTIDPTIQMTCWDIVQHFSDLFSDSISCGYISMLLRCLPYLDISSAREEVFEAVKKELEASQGGGVEPKYPLNYRANFHPSRDTPYRPGSRPDVSIAYKLRGGIRRLSSNLIVPRLGNKNIPLPSDYDTTYRPYEVHTDGKEIKTLKQVERVYYACGVELAGTSRMKTVWRSNDLKPRVYYSRGASLHRSSAYIQQIFNCFVDALENTHRIDRHNTSSLNPGKDDLLSIYDYSSFTSLLSELPRFTAILAEEFQETYITVLDPHNGPILVSVGELLDDYNENCNVNPKFDASEVLEVEEMVMYHNTGMLGVPGNISSATLLHGIHLAVVIQAARKCKVVGDDAIYFDKDIRDDLVREAIQDLGKVAVDKMESWKFTEDVDEDVDSRFDYKKRPINRLENVILTGFLLDFPPLTLCNIINPLHRSFAENDIDLEVKMAKRMSKFMDDLAHFPSKISDIGARIVSVSQQALYRMRGWSFEGGKTKIGVSYVPIRGIGLKYSDWIRHFSPELSMRLPVVYVGRKLKPDSYRTGQVFYQKSSGLLSYLVAVGCLEDISEYETVPCKDLVDSFGSLSSRIDSIPIRKFAFLEDPPYWFEDYFETFNEVDV